jgi:Mg-chelatase subunit ChlD
MITDGEATYPVQRGRDAIIELKKVTAVMNIPNTEWIVVDSSLVPGKIDYAAELAMMLNGKCIRLEDLQSV